MYIYIYILYLFLKKTINILFDRFCAPRLETDCSFKKLSIFFSN